jgi:dopamine beta-monooxygenase
MCRQITSSELNFVFQFEPIIKNEAYIHHMEVFHCETSPDTEIPLYNGDCNDLPAAAKVCSKVIALWAMGAATFTYPAVTGLPIGGKDYNPYIRLEVHFNNPKIDSGKMQKKKLEMQEWFHIFLLQEKSTVLACE